MATTKQYKPVDITKSGPQSFRDLQAQNDFNSEVDPAIYSALMGLAPVVSQHDLFYNSPKPFRTPLMDNETGEHLGSSIFDKSYLTDEDLYQMQGNPNELRAEAQPWFSKLVNGIGKAAVLAATTFAEGIGLLYGAGQGLVAKNDKSFLQDLWDNPVTNALQSINEASEKWMPNYYTQDEIENPFGNIFTANFLGDKLLKNLGFMVGAYYGGIPIAKGIGKAGQWLVRTAREAQQAERLGMATALKDIRAAAGGDATKLEKMLEARHLTEAERGERLKQGLDRINNIAQTTRATTQVIGSLASAVNEGAIEAINNSKDWAKMKTLEENDRYQQLLNEIDLAYDGIETEEAIRAKMEAAEEHNQRLAEIEKGRATMGNADMLMNIPILTYSNFLQLGKLYSRGFDTTRRKMGSYLTGHDKLSADTYKRLLRGERKMAGEVGKDLRSTKTWKGGIARGLRNAFTEGAEEYLQRSASDAAGEEVANSIDRYFRFGKSEDSKIELDDYIAGFAKSVADNAGNPQAWEEFMIGALSSMVGMPVFGSQTKNAYGFMKNNGVFGFAGGMVGNYEDYMAEKANEENIAKYLNNRVNEDSFKALYSYLRKSNDYEKALMEALNNNDKEEYKNLEAEKLFEDINAFASSGHLEEFKQLIGYNEEYDAAELSDIVKNTRRVVSAAEQIQNDKDKLNNVKLQIQELEKYAIVKGSETDKTLQNLIKERDALQEKISKPEEYKDRDEGEFVQMVNGVPIGMDTIPDTDEEGNPIKGTEGNEMRRILDRNRQKLLKGINDYLSIRNNIDVETDGRLKDDEIAILTRIRMQIQDQENRTLEMSSDLINGLKPIQELQKKAEKRAERAKDKAKDAYDVAKKLLEDAKKTKDISPDTIAELEQDVVNAEKDYETAKKGLSRTQAVVAITEAMTQSVKTTRRERKALDKGYGRDEDGNTYSDLYDNSIRDINSDEAMQWLADDLNVAVLKGIVNMQTDLTDEEKKKYTDEIQSLQNLALLKMANRDLVRKYLKDPSLINEAMQDSADRMTEEEKDNKSDELAFRIRKAKNASELDSIIRNSPVHSDVINMAIQKAKQDGDEDTKKFLADYEKARNFMRALREKSATLPSHIYESFNNNVGMIWNEALNDESATSTYDKFIELLNDSADEMEATDKEQADAIRNAIKELDKAAEATTTNDSSNVATPSSASSNTSGNASSGNAAAKGTNGTSGTSGAPKSNITRDKIVKVARQEIGTRLNNGMKVDGISDLFKDKNGKDTPLSQWVTKYNEQNPDKQIGDELVKEILQELSDEALNDSVGDGDKGSRLIDTDYESSKSSQMKGHLRVVFKSDGVTEFRVFEGSENGVRLESKESYELSDIGEAIHEILENTGAYRFVSSNLLGYLQQKLSNQKKPESVKIHFLRPKDDRVGKKVFLAIEWNNDVAAGIKKIGFGENSDVTIPDTSIRAVDKDGNVKNYQIVGDFSVLEDDKDMDPGIIKNFHEVEDSINEELNPILDDDAKNKGEEWAVSSINSYVDDIYTGRLVEKENRDDSADRKVDLYGMVSNSTEWESDAVFFFGVATKNENMDCGETNNRTVKPSSAWFKREDSRGAVVLFVPRPDGKYYPVRCTRKTVEEWLKDSNGLDLLNKTLDGTADRKNKNSYLVELVDNLKKLMNSETNYGERVKAKMNLGRYFVMGFGGRKVSVGFDGDIVRVNFGEAAANRHTIQVENNGIDKAVLEFFDIMKEEGIPFSIPLPSESTSISPRDIISSGIFKTGVKEFYNFNPSFTILPINKNGEVIEPEIPEEDRGHFTGSSKLSPRERLYDLGHGENRYLIYENGRVYKNGKDITDEKEGYVVKTAYMISKDGGEEAIYSLLEKALPGNNYKDTKNALKNILKDSWERVFLIRTPDGDWIFDARSPSHKGAKLIKFVNAGALMEEFQKDIDKNMEKAMTMTPEELKDKVENKGKGDRSQYYIDAMDTAETLQDNEEAMKVALGAGIAQDVVMAAYNRNKERLEGRKDEKNPKPKAKDKVVGTDENNTKILAGKELKDFKSSKSSPRVVSLLKEKKSQDVLGDYVDTIYKDLQSLEAMGESVLSDDILSKIEEIRKLKKASDRKKTWEKFVSDKTCKK